MRRMRSILNHARWRKQNPNIRKMTWDLLNISIVFNRHQWDYMETRISDVSPSDSIRKVHTTETSSWDETPVAYGSGKRSGNLIGIVKQSKVTSFNTTQNPHSLMGICTLPLPWQLATTARSAEIWRCRDIVRTWETGKRSDEARKRKIHRGKRWIVVE